MPADPTREARLPFPFIAVCLGAAALAAAMDRAGAVPLSPRKVVFEIRYENHAWGTQLAGTYVDTAGRIYRYARQSIPGPVPKGIDYDTTERVHAIGDVDLVGQVDPDTMRRMYALIPAAAAGELTPARAACVDAGDYRYLAYYLEPGSRTYTLALLYQAGNTARRNRSSEAETLSDWLDSLTPDAGHYRFPHCGPRDESDVR